MGFVEATKAQTSRERNAMQSAGLGDWLCPRGVAAQSRQIDGESRLQSDNKETIEGVCTKVALTRPWGTPTWCRMGGVTARRQVG